MTACLEPPLGLPMGAPIQVVPSGEAWVQVRDDLSAYGTVLVYGSIDTLLPDRPDREQLRAVLGRRWTRHLDLAQPLLPYRYAAAEALLRCVAAVIPGVDPHTLELFQGPGGRPSVRGWEQIDVGFSHWGDLLFAGLTTRGLVGIEVERADRPVYGEGLARYLCTPQDLVALAKLPREERDAALLRLALLRAAYVKAAGWPDAFHPLRQGTDTNGGPAGTERPDGTSCSRDEWTLRTFNVNCGFVLGVAVYDVGEE